MELKLNDTEGYVLRDTCCKALSIRSSKQERGDYNFSELNIAKPTGKNLRKNPPRNDPRISRHSFETNHTVKSFLTSKSDPKARKPRESTVKVKEPEMQKSTFLNQILVKIITGCMERGQDVNPLLNFLKNELNETPKPGLIGVEKSSKGSDTMYRRCNSAVTWEEVQTLDSNHKESMLSVIRSAGDTSLPEQGVDMVDVLLRGDNVVLPNSESPCWDNQEEPTEEEKHSISDSKAKTKCHSRPQQPSIELQSDNSHEDRTRSCKEKSRVKDMRICEEKTKFEDKISCEENLSVKDKRSCKQKSNVKDIKTCEENSRVKDKRSCEEKFRVEDKRSCEAKFRVKHMRSCEEESKAKDKRSCEVKLSVKAMRSCEEKSNVKDMRSCEEKSNVKDMRSCEEKSNVKDMRSCEEKSNVKDMRSCEEKSNVKDKRSCEEKSNVKDMRSCEEKFRVKEMRSCDEKSKVQEKRSCEEKFREPPCKDDCLRFKVFNSKWDKEYAERCKVEVDLMRCI